MPTYTFRLPARFASTPVTVYNTADVQQTTGTTDSNAVFQASLAVGDYYAKISYGYTSYRAAGEVDRGDLDGISDTGIGATYTAKVEPRLFASRELAASDGSPGAIVDGSIWQAWSLPQAAASSVVGTYRVPAGVTKIDAVVRFWQRGAGTGNVCFRLDTMLLDDGGLVSGAIATGTKVAAAVPGTLNQLATATLKTDLTVTPGSLLAFKVYRVGTDVLDTFTAAAVAVGGVRINPKVS